MKKVKIQIKKVMEDNIEYFDNLDDAAASVKSNLDIWKVKMLINYAIIKKGRAFKASWQKIQL